MPVTNAHPLYVQRQDQWRRCRDAFAGADAIKAAGQLYLPKGSMDDEDYTAYAKRATWYGATRRTILGLTGAVMRKEPTHSGITTAEGKDFLDNVTSTGTPLSQFAKALLQQVLTTGRVGILTDMPAGDLYGDQAVPYWCMYEAENIRNWRVEMRNGKYTLTMVVLKEFDYQIDPADEFAFVRQDVYKILRLKPSGEYTVQRVTISYNQQTQKAIELFEQEVVPRFQGRPLDYIPFSIINTIHSDACPDDPPLLDLADMNISHYRTTADLKHGLHFVALPTPWAAGFGALPEGQTRKIGPSVIWETDQVQASAGLLEFTGQGLGSIREEAKEEEKKMAVLGARMLEPQQPDIEAADTMRVRNAGEQSMLQTSALTISLSLTQQIRWTLAWMNKASEKAEIRLNQDLVSNKMDSTTLSALVQALMQSAISYETFYHNLEKGEMTRPGVEAAKEQALIEAQRPKVEPLALTPDDDEEETDPATGRPGQKKLPAPSQQTGHA